MGKQHVKISSLLVAIILSVQFILPTEALAVTLTDINKSHFKKEILALAEAGVLGGHPDGTFKPNAPITRAEFASMLARAMKLTPAPEAASKFKDVHAWARGAVGALVKAGIAGGKSNSHFGADDYLTREEMTVFFVRALGFQDAITSLPFIPQFKDVNHMSPAFKPHIAFSDEIGLVNGYKDGRFGPKDRAKREHVAGLTYKFFFQNDRLIANGNKVIADKKAEQPKKTVKIFIDPGHGGHDPGAVNGDLREKDINLDIGLRVRDILVKEYWYVQVKMSRESDVYVDLHERPRMANAWGADYFVSIHQNAGGGTGFESYIYNGPTSPITKEKQQIIHDYIVNALDLRDRGKKSANFAVLRETSMPALLLELQFIDHPEDAARLRDPKFRQQIARVLAEAIAFAWELPKK